MFTIAARRLGYHVHVYSPESDTPAGQVADVEVVGDYTDEEALLGFARQVDVVTLEFENIPSQTLALLQQHVPVRPGQHVLHTTQHRLREKKRRWTPPDSLSRTS